MSFFACNLATILTNSQIFKNPTSTAQQLSSQLPSSAIFFLTYMSRSYSKQRIFASQYFLVTQGLAGAGSAIVQLAPLIFHFVRKWFLGRTPRQAYGVTFRMPAVRFKLSYICIYNQSAAIRRILERSSLDSHYLPQYRSFTAFWRLSLMFWL